MRVRSVQVRILCGAPYAAVVQLARTSACQVEGHGFESRLLLQNYPESKPQDQEEDEEEAEDVLLILSDGTTIIGI